MERRSSLAGKLALDLADNSIKDADKILKSFARVSIFAQKWQVKVEEVVPRVTMETFVRNIGGLLGMWLGLSVISVMESFEETIIGMFAVRPKNG